MVPRVYDDFEQDDTRLDPLALIGNGLSAAQLAGRRSGGSGTMLMPAAQALRDQASNGQAPSAVLRVRSYAVPALDVSPLARSVMSAQPPMHAQAHAPMHPNYAQSAHPASVAPTRGRSNTGVVLVALLAAVAGLVLFTVAFLTFL